LPGSSPDAANDLPSAEFALDAPRPQRAQNGMNWKPAGARLKARINTYRRAL
jgi:hypothetical protein